MGLKFLESGLRSPQIPPLTAWRTDLFERVLAPAPARTTSSAQTTNTMAEPQPPSRGTTPGLTPGVKRPHEEDHVPAVPSPLNPDPVARSRPAKAPQREQREKRDSLKKREAQASSRGTTPDIKVKNKLASAPAPLNYIVETENLKLQDFEAPKAPAFISHEPPLFTPDGQLELKRPLDQYVLPLSSRQLAKCFPARRTAGSSVTILALPILCSVTNNTFARPTPSPLLHVSALRIATSGSISTILLPSSPTNAAGA